MSLKTLTFTNLGNILIFAFHKGKREEKRKERREEGKEENEGREKERGKKEEIRREGGQKELMATWPW